MYLAEYVLWAGGSMLVAESLEELAELCDCAIRAGDRVERVRVREGRMRHLRRDELVHLLACLAAVRAS